MWVGVVGRWGGAQCGANRAWGVSVRVRAWGGSVVGRCVVVVARGMWWEARSEARRAVQPSQECRQC